MRKRRQTLPMWIQILTFVVITLLGLATNYLANNADPGVGALDLIRRWALPAALALLVLTVLLMIWHNRADQSARLPQPEWDSDRAPYPGLEAFTRDDAGVFFGREFETRTLLERLNPPFAAPGFQRSVAVVGPSGIGKSSVLSAGVLAQLQRRKRDWIIVPPIVPGNRPMSALAAALAASLPGRPVEATEGTSRWHSARVNAIRDTLGRRRSSVLLVIDQAEELLTIAGQDECHEFLSVISEMIENDESLWVILSCRSEFLTAFLQSSYSQLFSTPFAIGALNRAGLVKVIEGPAEKAGIRFEPTSLPHVIASDTDGGNALPLLAYTLQELCIASGRQGVITAAAYENIGGVRGVLSRQADRVTGELTRLDPTVPVLETLLKFVTIGENEPTRRRVLRSALSPEERRIVDAFVSARLLTTDASAADGPHGETAVLDVAHEALFRHWPPLRQQITASAEILRVRADLERWAQDWERSGRDDSYLLRHERLLKAQEWATLLPDLERSLPQVAEFLNASRHTDEQTLRNLSEAIARQSLLEVEQNAERALSLALAAYEECFATPLAQEAIVSALQVARLRRVVDGHKGGVWGLGWSPDGQYLASAANDKTVRIWNARDGSVLSVCQGHTDGVRSVSWAPDSCRVLTASNDRTIRVWDALSGASVAVLSGHTGWVRQAEFAPNGARAASVSDDQTIRIWDVAEATEIQILRGHSETIRAVAWSPDASRLVTGSDDSTVRIWNLASGVTEWVLTGHDGGVRGVSWSPDGRLVASTSYDATIRLWDPATGEAREVLRGHTDWIRRATWSPDGSSLASAAYDHTIRLWDVASAALTATISGHSGGVWDVCWSPDGQSLASASEDREIRIWDRTPSLPTTALQGHGAMVWTVAWTADGGRVATGSEDRLVRVFDSTSGVLLETFHGHQAGVRGLVWAPDGRLISCGADSSVRIWDVATPDREPFSLPDISTGAWDVALSAANELAVACDDRTVRIWDLASATLRNVLTGHGDWVRAVRWSPDGGLLASASYDQTIRLWDVGLGVLRALLNGHTAGVRSVAFSPNGSLLASAADDATVRIWRVDSGAEIAVLQTNDAAVRAVVWHPDGTAVLCAGHDGTLRLWNVTSRQQLVVGIVIGRAECLAIAADGRRVVAGGDDSAAQIWITDVTADQMLDLGHRRRPRPLTADERRALLLPGMSNRP